MAEFQSFPESVMPLTDRIGRSDGSMFVEEANTADLDTPLSLHFALNIGSEKKAKLDQIASSGAILDANELATSFGCDLKQITSLTQWLISNGFEVIYISGNNANVYARATARRIASACNVTMVRVTIGLDRFVAAADIPRLPLSVGRHIEAIVGLQPFLRARKGVPALNADRHHQEDKHDIEARGGPIPSPIGAVGYFVAQIKKAYGAEHLAADGAGQVVAVLIDTFPRDTDIQGFWNNNGMPNNLGRIQKVNVKGGTLPPPEGEETLDVEWASGIATGATVRVYATQTLNFADLNLGLDKIIDDLPSTPSLRQVSISLGQGETFIGGANAIITTQHAKYAQLAAAGVNVFVSSGDGGSNPDPTGKPGGPLHVSYPSSDSCVVSVGGTTLRLNGDNSNGGESGWSGSGGGISQFVNRPVWQRGSDIPSGNFRLVPDVAAAADPATGAYFFFNGAASSIGGTSWSTPVWAAFCALVNQMRVSRGQTALPFLNPQLFGYRGTKRLRDITTGSNGAYNAGPGYDLVTGLGTPRMTDLAQSLTSGTLIVFPTTDINATGLQGGPFTPTTFAYSVRASEGTIEFTVSAPEWLSVSPSSGVVTTTPTQVTFSVNDRAKSYPPSVVGPVTIEFLHSGIGSTLSIQAKLTVRNANIIKMDSFPNAYNQQGWGGALEVGIVVGTGDRVPDGSYAQAIVWTKGQPSGLEFPPTPIESTQALGCDRTGQIIVGTGSNHLQFARALRWRNGRVEVLNPLSGDANCAARAVSANGKCAVGTSSRPGVVETAVRWMNDYIDPQPLEQGYLPKAVSADGSVIVGYQIPGSAANPVRWIDRSGELQKEALPTINGHFGAIPQSISNDGKIIVGFTQITPNKRKAVVWKDNQIVMLEPAVEAPGSTASVISGSGEVIFGTRNIGGLFRWTQRNGIESVISLLEAAKVDLSRWFLEDVTAVSFDGSIISGLGQYTAPGQKQTYIPFVVELPLPR